MKLDYSLQKIHPSVTSFELADVPFDPSGDYHLAYRLYSLTRAPKHAGELHLIRKRNQDQAFELKVNCRRLGVDDHHAFAFTRFQCREDDLATPLQWQVNTRISKTFDSPPVPYTRLARHGSFDEKRVTLLDGDHQRSVPVSGSLSSKWTLMEAVQRLGTDTPGEPFSCLDEFDAVRPGHRLESHEDQVVTMAGRERTLRGYLHTGEAVIPRSLWVDEQGMLLFVTTGTEAAILARAGTTPTKYKDRYTISKLNLI